MKIVQVPTGFKLEPIFWQGPPQHEKVAGEQLYKGDCLTEANDLMFRTCFDEADWIGLESVSKGQKVSCVRKTEL